MPDLIGFQHTLGDQERLLERYWLTLKFSALAFRPELVHAVAGGGISLFLFFFDAAIGLTIDLFLF